MFCPNCGKELEEGSADCPGCGANVGEAARKLLPEREPFPPPGPAVEKKGMPRIAIVAIGCGALLFIGIPVVGILAAIAIPNFLKFQAKARQSEAKTNLSAIFTTQIAYYGEFETYASKFDDLQWEPYGTTRYAYFLPNQVIQPTQGTPISLPLDVEPYVDGESFMIIAVGNIDNDDDLDVWTMDDGKMLNNVFDDIRGY